MPYEFNASAPSFHFSTFESHTYEAPQIDHPTTFDYQTDRVAEFSKTIFNKEDVSTFADDFDLCEDFSFPNAEYECLVPLSSGNGVVPLVSWLPLNGSDMDHVQLEQPSFDYYDEIPSVQKIDGSNPSATIVPLEQMVFPEGSVNSSDPFLWEDFLDAENIADHGNSPTKKTRTLEEDLSLIESERKKSHLGDSSIFLNPQPRKLMTKWTPEKNETLWKLRHDQKLEWNQICAVMKDFSFNSLKARYVKLKQQRGIPSESRGLKSGTPRKPYWTEEDQNELIRLVDEGKDWPEIGNLLKRTPDSVRLRYQTEVRKERQRMSAENALTDEQINESNDNGEMRMNMPTARARAWTKQEIAELIQYRANNMPWKIIGAKLGRTPDSSRHFYKNQIRIMKNPTIN